MGYYICIPILALAAALQSSVVPQFRLYSGQVDVVLLLVITWAVHAELEEGLFWAFTGGILQDLLSITPLGTSSIGMVTIVFGLDFLRRRLFRINLIWLTGTVILGTVLQQTVIYLALLIQGSSYDIIEVLRYVLLPGLFFNLVLLLPVYLVVRLFQRRIYRNRITN
jgi:rod shape-determining protein MreD